MVADALCLLSSSKMVILSCSLKGCCILGALTRFGLLRLRGQADEVMVLHGRVREVDRIGNSAPDEAADFGRRRVGHLVIDARRNLSGVCGRWYPVVLDLHRFF